jgi:hypothetical protein
VDNANPPDAAEHAAFEKAFANGNFQQALGAYQHGQLIRAITLLKVAGYSMNPLPETTTAHAGALALITAIDQVIQSEGDQASYKLHVARQLFAAVARLQGMFEAPIDRRRDPNELLAELVLAGAELGAAEARLSETMGGLFDEYMMLKHSLIQSRESRRRGAAKVNEGKATAKQNALDAAIRIAAKNATLGNEDIALKLHESVAVNTTVKTITQWVREWRRRELLPPQKKL